MHVHSPRPRIHSAVANAYTDGRTDKPIRARHGQRTRSPAHPARRHRGSAGAVLCTPRRACHHLLSARLCRGSSSPSLPVTAALARPPRRIRQLHQRLLPDPQPDPDPDPGRYRSREPRGPLDPPRRDASRASPAAAVVRVQREFGVWLCLLMSISTALMLRRQPVRVCVEPAAARAHSARRCRTNIYGECGPRRRVPWLWPA